MTFEETLCYRGKHGYLGSQCNESYLKELRILVAVWLNEIDNQILRFEKEKRDFYQGNIDVYSSLSDPKT